MIRYHCPDCRLERTDAAATQLPRPGPTACPRCGQPHTVLSLVAAPRVIVSTLPVRPPVL